MNRSSDSQTENGLPLHRDLFGQVSDLIAVSEAQQEQLLHAMLQNWNRQLLSCPGRAFNVFQWLLNGPG